MFSQMGLSYKEHMARSKRRQKTPEEGPAQSQTSTETPSTCSMGPKAGDCFEAFPVELARTCGLTDSVHDTEAEAAGDFAELVTGGKLGKDLIPMRVGSGSTKRWVVWEVTAACGCEDVALAHVAREFLIFPYSHNIPGVIVTAMDLKGKALALIYGVVNMADRARKQRAVSTGLSDSRRSSKEAKDEKAVEEKVVGEKAKKAVGGSMLPLGIGDFEISEMELVVKSPLKMASPAGFLTLLHHAGEGLVAQGTPGPFGLRADSWDVVHSAIEAGGCLLGHRGGAERCCFASSLGENLYA